LKYLARAWAFVGVAFLLSALAIGLSMIHAYGAQVPNAPSAPSTATTLDPLAPSAGIDVGPSSTNETTTTTVPVVDDNGLQGNNKPGLFDIGGRVRNAIDSWFRNLVTSALNPTLDLLSRSVLSTPDITHQARVHELWMVSAGIANGCFVLLILVGGAIVMSHETLQTRYAAKDIAPRLVIAIVAANASLALVGTLTPFANAFASSFLSGGISNADASNTMKALALAPLDSGGIFLILVALVVAALAIALVAMYVARIAALVLLVIGGPIALASHALPQTESLAKMWWRGIIGALSIQVAQSLVLITAMRIFFTNDGKGILGLADASGLVDLLVILCLLWILFRIPFWIFKMVFRQEPPKVFNTIRSITTKAAVVGG
jgi:hypothetical protein